MSGVAFSGLLDSAKKVFDPIGIGSASNKVTREVISKSIQETHHVKDVVMNNPILKTVAIAVAVYFTAGLALSYFGSTAAFAASMPGWGAGGMFSEAAVGMGMGSGAAAGSGLAATYAADSAATVAAGGGAAAVGAGAADTGATTAGAAAASGEGGGAIAGTGEAAAAGDTGTAAGTGAIADGTGATAAPISQAVVPASNLAPVGAGAEGGSGAAAGGMSSLEKIYGAKVAADAIGGALAPSANQQAEADKKFRGSYFGTNGDGSGGGIVPQGGFNILPSGGFQPVASNGSPNAFAPRATGGVQQPTYNLLPAPGG